MAVFVDRNTVENACEINPRETVNFLATLPVNHNYRELAVWTFYLALADCTIHSRKKLAGNSGSALYKLPRRFVLIEEWIKEIKTTCDLGMTGMILIHNGVVRGTTKDGRLIGKMQLSYDSALLEETLAAFRKSEGIIFIRAWINQGDLEIGDDIMKVCVAGRFRTDVMPVFQELLAAIKGKVVTEMEV